MSNASWRSSTPAASEPALYPLALSSERGHEPVGYSSRKRKSPGYIPLAQVKNVRPTQFMRRTNGCASH
eukprot:1409808-Pleurochrysis_carterae.AAC.1